MSVLESYTLCSFLYLCTWQGQNKNHILVDRSLFQTESGSFIPRGERIQSVLQRIALGIMHNTGNTGNIGIIGNMGKMGNTSNMGNMGNVGWGWDWALGKKDKIVSDLSCPIKRSSDDHRESFNLTDLI